MSYVFRLLSDNQDNNILDWKQTQQEPYGESSTSKIKDPDGGSIHKEITSIPSPFARVDLVRMAFAEVARMAKDNVCPLDAQDTIYHKLVSDTLDVAEIFFNIDKYADFVKIIEWRKDSLEDLISGNDPFHKQLGQTIKMFWEQDGANYNFDQEDRIYLLNYLGKCAPTRMNVIGATSPKTLFFTSANRLDYVSGIVFGNNDKPFDSELQPLYKRDATFVKYIFALRDHFSDYGGAKVFGKDLKELNDYLTETFKKLDDKTRRFVDSDPKAFLDDLPPVSVDGGSEASVLGFTLRKRNPNVKFDSGFALKAARGVADGERSPLVLPSEPFSRPWMYTTSEWVKDTQVPLSSSLPLLDRTLPADGSKYPFICIGDFLQDSLIVIPQPANADYYMFCAAPEALKDVSFLLPVKPLFFKYFSTEDLRKLLSISASADGSLTATLKIPVAKGEIVYSRRYVLSDQPVPDGVNEGRITEKNFTFHIFPFVKLKKGKQDEFADFRVNIVNGSDGTKFSLDFIDPDGALVAENSAADSGNNSNDSSSSSSVISTFYRNELDGEPIDRSEVSPQITTVRKIFSAVVISDGGAQGVVVPEFRCDNIVDKVRFAVDLGTSYTFISMQADDDPHQISDLQFMADERIFCPLTKRAFGKAAKCLLADWIPYDPTDDTKMMPMRSILSARKKTVWTDGGVSVMCQTNIPMAYGAGITLLPGYNKLYSNVKWSGSDAEDAENSPLGHYIENLCELMLAKTLKLGADPEKTELVFFYPCSMTKSRTNMIAETWQRCYEKFFHGDGKANVKRMTESVAPYYSIRGDIKNSSAVCIDIGGGTSDFVFAADKEVKLISSCRFAANALFDPADDKSLEISPFVNNFKDRVLEVLRQNRLPQELIVRELLARDDVRASDVVMCFFALKDVNRIKDAGLSSKLDYSGMIGKDSNCKLLALTFYTALIYHAAKIIAVKNLSLPDRINFSGNGSKVIDIVTHDLEALALYTKLVLTTVTGQEYSGGKDLIIMRDKNPKAVTCRGGLGKDADFGRLDREKVVCLVGENTNMFANDGLSYKALSDEIFNGVSLEVEKFLSVFASIYRKFGADDEFGTPSKADFMRFMAFMECNASLEIKNGVDDEKDESDRTDDQPLASSLFFYPIKAMLRNLSQEMSSNS